MNEKAAWAIGLGLLLGSLLMGCCTSGPWGGGTVPYTGGYGPAAAGPAATVTPQVTYGQPSGNTGWRAAGAAQPATDATVTP